MERKQGLFPSSIIARFFKNEERYIATMLVGNNIALVVYGLIMAKLIEPIIMKYLTDVSFTVLIIQTIFSTLIILITAEFLPKTIFRMHPNKALNIFALPVMFFYVLFYPITVLTVWLSNHVLRRIFKIPADNQEKFVFGKVDLNNFLEEQQRATPEDAQLEPEIKIFQNALDFSRVKLRECMVPRPELETIEVDQTIEKLTQKFVKTGYSRILVYQDSIDNIIGYVHSSELFKRPKRIIDMLNTVPLVPESMQAHRLLTRLIQQQKSLAVVVDEFGGTAGIVTIEDIMEEIFGEIEDEHDISEFTEEEIDENQYRFSGRLEIDYLNEKYNLNLPDSEDYETLAGLILHHYESMPEIGEEILIDNQFWFYIEKVSDTRIDSLILSLTDTDN